MARHQRYVYRLEVPAHQSDAVIDFLSGLGLVDEQYLTVLHAPDGSGEDDGE